MSGLGLGLVLLLLEVDSIASFFATIPLPHVEQNFATSSILDPHEAQNSYIPPIILLPLPYHMLLYFRYSLKGPCVRYNSELYLTQGRNQSKFLLYSSSYIWQFTNLPELTSISRGATLSHTFFLNLHRV